MAVIRSGPLLDLSGTIDGWTYSPQPNGTTVVKRKNKKRSKPATPGQQANENDTGLFAKFMAPINGFVSVGYELEAKKLGLNPYNAMVKCMRKNAFKGEYPDRSIDFSKILVSKGTLPIPVAKASITDAGLAFSWDTTEIPHATHHSDQVMLLAYFPKSKDAVYVTGGAARHVGKDLLNLRGIKKGEDAEVYISFLTDDRKNISNSVYLGKFSW
ncbi:DUF6266 family protein [Pedobacter sp. AW31-3R]|uniref:DUF6266 family protein n=1 Tax=Pedobacter sp. AW31-3R TaxID=3445781 RepID=UPI003FA10A91